LIEYYFINQKIIKKKQKLGDSISNISDYFYDTSVIQEPNNDIYSETSYEDLFINNNFRKEKK